LKQSLVTYSTQHLADAQGDNGTLHTTVSLRLIRKFYESDPLENALSEMGWCASSRLNRGCGNHPAPAVENSSPYVYQQTVRLGRKSYKYTVG